MVSIERSRLRVGVDVPWVTSWSAETILGAAPCASVAGTLAIGQVERPGQGKPQYSKNHLLRQRLSVRDLLCPMCGAPTSDADRWCVTARRRTLGEVRARFRGLTIAPKLAHAQVVIDAGGIAPLHRACAERSMSQCPHLRGLPDSELIAFPERWIVIPLWVHPDAPALYGAAAPPPAVGFLQLLGVALDPAPAQGAGMRRRAARRARA